MQAIESFDQAVWNGLQTMRLQTPGLVPVMWVVSFLGSPLLLAISALAAVVLWGRRHQRAVLGFVLAVVGALVLAYGAKLVVQRPRPDPFHPSIGRPPLTAFPSVTACGAAACYGYLALTFAQRLRRPMAARALVLGMGLWVMAVGFSRLYFSWSYLSDVAAGWIAGLVWALVCCWWAHDPFSRAAQPSA